ncbi:phosphoglycerate dehydrogenase [Pelosinus sp. IPA-1]|uniref:phosphoglycerate dehydrogenase n=1 Tax=Pelosinus sp. IPA-1 TaxID=3029569 RepID=UPI002436226A|nr:phosphoglycerate dehydrogenase [Pelosinus sp. IPA-1]GMA98985.1 4-phosphoerythronate dehydrogenase [Pelosinus sp. IPA-1]
MYKWKIVVTAVTFAKADPEPLNRLKAIGCEVITNSHGRPLTEGEMINIAQDVDALIVGNDKVTSAIIRSCPKLKVIAKHGVGVDAIDSKTANECGVVVTNAPGVNSHEVADLAFGLLHMLSRGLYIANKATKEGNWLKPMGVGLWEKTIGIIGVGKIGLATAYRATGYNMKILGFDCVERLEAKKIGIEYVGLEELLQQSDFISLHLPLTKKTRNILDHRRLDLVKPGAILINTARSQLVEYGILHKALLDGRIRGYGVDVYDFEPPQLHPMFSLDNVILSPHLGGTCYESNIRMGNTAVDNVIAVLEARTPPNRINEVNLLLR